MFKRIAGIGFDMQVELDKRQHAVETEAAAGNPNSSIGRGETNYER